MRQMLRTIAITLLVVGPTMWSFTGRAQTTGDRAAEAQLKAAENKQLVDGDLKGALDAYSKLSTSRDRTVAAKALLRMGECYQALGDAQAAKVYEQIVKDFPSQPEAGEARSRLSAIRRSSSPTATSDRVIWTMNPGNIRPTAVSHDGRLLVFQQNLQGKLGVHDFATNTDQFLGDSEHDWTGDAMFSRDDKRIALTWFNWKDNRDELRVADVHSSGLSVPRFLFGGNDVSYIEPYDWTADGRWISALLDLADDSEQIALLPTETGAARILKTIRRPNGAARLSLSPDDKYLAFATFDGTSRAGDISVIRLDGTGETVVVQNRADDEPVGWSPDGSRLLFTSDRFGSIELLALPMIDGRPQGPPERLKVDLPTAYPLGLTATGILVYSKGAGQPGAPDLKIATINPATGQLTTPLADLVREYVLRSNQGADFSPDGKSIAYVSSQLKPAGLGDVTVAIRALATGATLELRPKLSPIYWVRWSPDGRAMVASGRDRQEGTGLWRIDATTGEAAVIALNDTTSTVSLDRWSPDSRIVYFKRSVGKSFQVTLFERDLTSGRDRELFRSAADGTIAPDPRISPDGKTVYYHRAIADNNKPPFATSAFIARDLATGAEHELIRRNLGAVNLSPDGRSIVTGSNDLSTKSRSILYVPTDGGQPRELMRIDLPPAYVDGTSTVNPLGVYKQGLDSDVIIVDKNFGTGAAVERSEYLVGARERWRAEAAGCRKDQRSSD